MHALYIMQYSEIIYAPYYYTHLHWPFLLSGDFLTFELLKKQKVYFFIIILSQNLLFFYFSVSMSLFHT